MSGTGKDVSVRATGEDAYFVASNSTRGFHSWYADCFDDACVGRVFAIKGGPGTGKSRFMRDVSEFAGKRGWRSEMIYCSSDPDSLDGVILSRPGQAKLAVLDATAPHVYEPKHPGYREELVDLGMFWSADALRPRHGELERLNAEKQGAYRRAYRYLSGYGEMSASLEELITPFIRSRAIAGFAAKLMRELPDGEEFSPRVALMRSVGMRGRVTFDTYFAQAEKICLITDCRGSGPILLRELYRLAAEKRMEVRVSRDPLLPERIDALFFPACRTAFAVGGSEECLYPHRTVSMRRFVDTAGMRSVKGSVNYAERVRRAMLTGAVEELDRAADIHFRIEAIYESAMDFPAKEEFTKAFCLRLFGEK